MADIELVIKIPEEDFERCKNRFQRRIDIMSDAIANGTPRETVTEFADRCRECGREKVLDKIRAEIWDLQYGDEEKSMTDEDRAEAYNNAIRQVIEIIDKYKGESEDKG